MGGGPASFENVFSNRGSRDYKPEEIDLKEVSTCITFYTKANCISLMIKTINYLRVTILTHW